MKPLPETKQSLWGEEYNVVPYLIEAIHGDGKKWLWFAYLDDRPSFYVVRVDSAVVPDNDNDQWYEEVLDWIYEQIMDEMTEFMTDDQYDEWQEKGFLEGGRPWPIPPLECPCGSEWGEYETDEENLKSLTI